MLAKFSQYRAAIFFSRFPLASIELRTYAVFAVVATLFQTSLIFWKSSEVHLFVTSIAGSSPALGYMYGLFFVFSSIYVTDEKQRKKLRFGIIAPLVLHIIFGLLSAFNHNGDYSNAYHQVSPWQPLFTIVLPLFWIVVLLSPRIVLKPKI